MGSQDVVTVVESRIMYKIIKGLKVSLPMLMVEHMEQASGTRVNLTLPYAPWLTKVFTHCGVSLEDEEEEEEPAGVIGKDLLRRMHVDLERAQARFQVEWEMRSKHRSGGIELGGEANASDSEETSTDDDVDAFVRVDRVAPPQGEERAPEPRVPSPPRADPWPVPPSQPPPDAWPPSAPFPHPQVMPDPDTIPSTSASTSASSDVAIILREIRNLSYGFRLLTHRFDTFENQCIHRFDYFEHELGALRLQARFPTSPIPSHASFRPERARDASSGSNEPPQDGGPVHISSSSPRPVSSHPPPPPPPPPTDPPLPHAIDKKGEKATRKRKFLSLEEGQKPRPEKRRKST